MVLDWMLTLASISASLGLMGTLVMVLEPMRSSASSASSASLVNELFCSLGGGGETAAQEVRSGLTAVTARCSQHGHCALQASIRHLAIAMPQCCWQLAASWCCNKARVWLSTGAGRGVLSPSC